MSGRIILSEKPGDNKAAAEWGAEQAELIKKRRNYTKAGKKIYIHHLVTQCTESESPLKKRAKNDNARRLSLRSVCMNWFFIFISPKINFAAAFRG